MPDDVNLGYNDTHQARLDTPTINRLSVGSTHPQTGESCNYDDGQT
jgi:hypothetical protein